MNSKHFIKLVCTKFALQEDAWCQCVSIYVKLLQCISQTFPSIQPWPLTIHI